VDIDGILLIDKDEGLTSFETVRKARRLLGIKKAGHAGTLDKSASGLLIVCIARATAVQSLLMSSRKLYRAAIHLGVETDTLDSYGRIVRTSPSRTFDESEIQLVLKRFQGRCMQVPPQFSAIHVGGERSYLRKLRGEDVRIEPRAVLIEELRLISCEKDRISIEARVSKGTYIRALARDIAEALGTCGYLRELRRLEIGPFSVKDAARLSDLPADERVIPLNSALSHIPCVVVDGEKALKIYDGLPLERVLNDRELHSLNDGFNRIVHGNELIAIIMKKDAPSYYRVFKPINIP